MINVSWDESRRISVSPSRKLCAKGDSHSQQIVFTLERYLDSGLDLINCTAAIATTNSQGGTNMIMLEKKDAGDKISLVLDVTKKLTIASGALKYQLIFTNTKADTVFKTIPDYFEIYDSIDASEDISEEYPCVVEQINEIFEKTKEYASFAAYTSDSMRNEVDKVKASAEEAAAYANETANQILQDKAAGLFKGDTGETGKCMFPISAAPEYIVESYTIPLGSTYYTTSVYWEISNDTFYKAPLENDLLFYLGEDISYNVSLSENSFATCDIYKYNLYRIVHVANGRAYVRKVMEDLENSVVEGYIGTIKGDTGENGKGISSILKTSGSSAPGSLDTYTITYTDNTSSVFTVQNGTNGAQGAQGDTGAAGADGEDGSTFTPTVSESGVLSWTNNKGLSNPQSINIKGPKGDTGAQGAQGFANITAAAAQLTSSGWSGTSAPYTQSVQISGMSATGNAIISLSEAATQEQYSAAAGAHLWATAAGADSVTITAFGEKPEINLPITVLILG